MGVIGLNGDIMGKDSVPSFRDWLKNVGFRNGNGG